MLNIKTMLLSVLLLSVQGFAAVVSPRAEPAPPGGFLLPADREVAAPAAPSNTNSGWVRVSRSCFKALQAEMARRGGEGVVTWSDLHWRLNIVGNSPGSAVNQVQEGAQTLDQAWNKGAHGEWRVVPDKPLGDGSVPLDAEMPHGFARVIGPVRALAEAEDPRDGGYYVVGVQLEQAPQPVDDAAVAMLIGMGLGNDLRGLGHAENADLALAECIGALRRSRGNVDMAAEELLQRE